jgi:hypothetical protein
MPWRHMSEPPGKEPFLTILYERAPVTHWIWGWKVSRSGQNNMEKITCTAWNRTRIIEPVSFLYKFGVFIYTTFLSTLNPSLLCAWFIPTLSRCCNWNVTDVMIIKTESRCVPWFHPTRICQLQNTVLIEKKNISFTEHSFQELNNGCSHKLRHQILHEDHVCRSRVNRKSETNNLYKEESSFDRNCCPINYLVVI